MITVVFLGLLLDLLAFTLLLPLLPGLLESHGRAHVRLLLVRVQRRPDSPHHSSPRPAPSSHSRVPQDPLYGSWQRGVDWFAAAIRMPAEKRYNSVLFGGRPTSPGLGPLQPSPDVCLCPASSPSQPLSPPSCFWALATSLQAQCPRVVRAPQLEAQVVGVQGSPHRTRPSGNKTSVSSRSHWLSLLLPAIPLGSAHRGNLGLSGEAPGDAAVPGMGVPKAWECAASSHLPGSPLGRKGVGL